MKDLVFHFRARWEMPGRCTHVCIHTPKHMTYLYTMYFHANRHIYRYRWFFFFQTITHSCWVLLSVSWPGKHLLLIPLFYYLSNPFLDRMTNFIPTAALIFPSQLLLPQSSQSGFISPSPLLATHILLTNLWKPRTSFIKTEQGVACIATARDKPTAAIESQWYDHTPSAHLHFRKGGCQPTLLSPDPFVLVFFTYYNYKKSLRVWRKYLCVHVCIDTQEIYMSIPYIHRIDIDI